MSQAATTGSLPSSATGTFQRAVTILVWMVIVGLAVGFILRNAIHYFLHYDQATFGRFWTHRGALLLHASGGIIALLTGPWQFFSGHRRTPMQVHRWTGRLFLAGVAMGSVGAAYLAITTTSPWAYGVGLFTMAVAQVSTAGMAYCAIRKRDIQAHKEWMIRAYVVTFAFVTFRIFNLLGAAYELPRADRQITLSWASWVVPS
jgi:Predicted membrane protein (DUF2306)